MLLRAEGEPGLRTRIASFTRGVNDTGLQSPPFDEDSLSRIFATLVLRLTSAEVTGNVLLVAGTRIGKSILWPLVATHILQEQIMVACPRRVAAKTLGDRVDQVLKAFGRAHPGDPRFGVPRVVVGVLTGETPLQERMEVKIAGRRPTGTLRGGKRWSRWTRCRRSPSLQHDPCRDGGQRSVTTLRPVCDSRGRSPRDAQTQHGQGDGVPDAGPQASGHHGDAHGDALPFKTSRPWCGARCSRRSGMWGTETWA